jgi:Asp/Glu/hydantoin racemase
LHAYHVESCDDMGEKLGLVTTTEEARAVIEEIAQCGGTFTKAFKRKAKKEAEYGRKDMLRAIRAGERIREQLANALNM